MHVHNVLSLTCRPPACSSGQANQPHLSTHVSNVLSDLLPHGLLERTGKQACFSTILRDVLSDLAHVCRLCGHVPVRVDSMRRGVHAGCSLLRGAGHHDHQVCRYFNLFVDLL